MSLRARTLGPADEPHAPPTPFAGLVSIALATLAAVALVPADPYPPSALFAPAAAMTLGLAIPPLLRLRRDLRHCFRVEHLLLLGVIYWLLLDLLQSAYPMEFVSSAHVELAFMSVGAFAFAVWLGARLAQGRPLPSSVMHVSLKLCLPLAPPTVYHAATPPLFAIWRAAPRAWLRTRAPTG